MILLFITKLKNGANLIMTSLGINIQSNLCKTTTHGTFQNGLNRQTVVLFRLGLNHPFTNAFKHSIKYHIMTLNIAENAL